MSSLRPTALGYKALAFYGVLIVVFFLLPYLNLYFLLLLFGTLIGCADLCACALRRRVPDLTIDDPGPVPAASPLSLTVRLQGVRGRPRTVSLVVHLLGRRLQGVAQTDAAEQLLDLEVPALPRGVHESFGVDISLVGPLGLFRRVRHQATSLRLVVYPVPTTAALMTPGVADGMGTVGGGRGEPAGLRDFRRGDELRDVHWRASARRGDWVVAEWDSARAEALEIRLDRGASDEELELRLSEIAAAALTCQERERALTLNTQGLHRTFGDGTYSITSLLEELARFQTLHSEEPQEANAPFAGAAR